MATSYTLPNFNLVMDYWQPGVLPVSGPAFTKITAQLYFHSRADIDIQANSLQNYMPSIYVRAPSAVLGAMVPPLVGGILGIGIASTNYYWSIRWWEFTHLLFPNQYITFQVQQVNNAGVRPDPTR